MTTAPLSPPPSKGQPAAPVGPWWHTALLLAIILTLSALQGQPRFMARAAVLPTKVPIYAETMVYELFLFGYVWIGLRLRGVSNREIIGGKWSRFSDVLIDIATAFLFWIAVIVVLAILTFALHFNGAQSAKPLLPQSIPEIATFVVLSVTAGFCEEFVFRGYLQRQFLALTKTVWIAVALQAIIFGAAHGYQGWRSMVAVSVYGALFGVLASVRKSLRPGMIQHAAQDTFSGIVGGILLKHKLI